MKLNRFLVCGLGSLGQHCVLALQQFGVKIVAIEQVAPQSWEVPNLVNLLDDLIIGDCRENNVLAQAQIQACRAALIVTSNEGVNAEIALAIRQLNPQTRLVVRSAKTNLNRLLSQQLGNFIAYEPIELPAHSFAIAALGTDTVGFFNLDGYWLRVVRQRMSPDHPWCNARRLHEINTRSQKLLAHNGSATDLGFYQWPFEELVTAGDVVTYIELADRFSLHATPDRPIAAGKKTKQPQIARWARQAADRFMRFWRSNFQQQVHRVALICCLIVIVLLAIATVLFHQYHPNTTWVSAFYASAILLLGGYGDLFGDFEQISMIPWWLQTFALVLSLAGTAFVGVLYAVLTESLLSSKFQFVKQRPPVPQQNHIIIVGLGRVGQQVALLLQQFKQAVVGVTLQPDINSTLLPDLPIITGNIAQSLAQANLPTAKSVIIVTDDEMLNLEVALMVQSIDPQLDLIIRTSGQRLSQHLTKTLPTARVLGMHTVSAEVFAGAAFGENILNLFHSDRQTILVTEYAIESGDTLDRLLLAEVAYGYGVVPILHQRNSHPETLMPTDDILLANGDRLVVLATTESLRRIDIGDRHPKFWYVEVELAMTAESTFEGANIIGRISGCSLRIARDLMENLPGILNVPLYQHQAQRLVYALEKVRVKAKIRPIDPIAQRLSLI
ncbi:NAD-binding protein [Chamaesiphon minutus]|uniref:K+ transport system, NAD-binding component n=1 Tax=Chamaesiphon minutus (strain ATCC 27169 / PCC 6605) TaxID=1173020 RepID=K9UGX2_CHAP6|nr:NAD-binding protein [Chamaesiphon minutus]AFY94065.1 K+ transport system, NAD-binding component [Chamaesiphon minutus PCC 6605]